MQDVGRADFDYMKFLNVSPLDGMETIPLNDFVNAKWVGEGLRKIWRNNYKRNKDKIIPVKRTDALKNKCCILIGSSPAIKKQVAELKFAQTNENFVLVACNGAYKFLLDNDIVPDYVVLIEGRDHVLKDVEQYSKGTILVVSPFADPRVYDIWKGEILTYMCGGGDRFDKQLRRDWAGKSDIDIGGGNVLNAAFLWSYKYLGCRNYITIGMSLCYYDEYYWDGRSTKYVMEGLEQSPFQAVDMYGNIVKTTSALLLYKTWLETYSNISGADFVNSTEDGILGVYPEPIEKRDDNIKFMVKYLPWMSIAPLNTAIDAYEKKLGDIKK